MSDFSPTLVLQFKTSKIINDMAKVQIKSEKVTPFGGIFHVNHRDSTYSINTNIDFSNSCGSGRDIAAPSQQLQIIGGAHAAELRKVLLDTYY